MASIVRGFILSCIDTNYQLARFFISKNSMANGDYKMPSSVSLQGGHRGSYYASIGLCEVW